MSRRSARALHTDAPTYQDVLDEAIEETFPASDPIAPAVAHAGTPVSTRRNPVDWRLEHRGDVSLDEIYRALKHGRGREHVDDANVGALIELARERGDTELEVLLREWRAPCGDDPAMPAR